MKEDDEKDMQKHVATYSKSTLLEAQQRRDLNLLQQTLVSNEYHKVLCNKPL